ncbi:MAG TPA: asparagine synthase-related protein [Thermoanaerobaculia bacterium]|jgi:asparagine synthase (glutamine-hydrolysing)
MSGIYGLVRFDGGADAAEARAMREAMAYWGADGGLHVDGVAALGGLLPHDASEGSAAFALPGGGVLVATARLDNRDELLARFELPRDADDRRLVAAAWEAWGERACERLFGDWSFAAWNPRDRRLVLARDHFGNTALYYHRGARALLFGSSRKALLALPEVPRRLNELRLAQHLAFWITDGAATLHDGILRLPPGHQLVATESSLHVTRYWHPEALPELRLRDDREYVDAFVERYDAAVRARLRTKRRIATTLSSGLDSGSVTALAARALAGRPHALTAFTSVPRFPEIAQTVPRMVVDEWDLAHLVAQRSGIADHRRLTAANVTTLAAFERSLFLHDEPEYGSANLHWIVGLLEESRDAGAGILLTGQLGNGGVSWSGDQQRPLRSLLSGRLFDSWKAIREFQRHRRMSFARAAYSQIVRPMVVRTKAFAFQRGWSELAMQHNLMSPPFARRLDISAKFRAARYDPLHSSILDARAQQLRVLLPDINPIGAIWHEAAAGYGLDILDPTADVRLLELVLRIPDEQFVRGANDRWLMRRGMEGLLPPEVQWNVRRGRQGADLPLRLQADGDELDGVVAQLAKSPIVVAYLDVATLTKSWAQVREGTPLEAFAAATLFARMLGFALFLDRTDFRDGAA